MTLGCRWLCLSVAAVAMAAPARAQAPPRAGAGLEVSGSIFNEAVVPGRTYEHTMIVSIPDDAPALDIVVRAMGLGQSLDGAVVPLAPDEDKSPYSALDSIVAIDKTAFRLEPGQAEEVTASIAVPVDFEGQGRYAVIHIGSEPAPDRAVAFRVAVDVPVILNPIGGGWQETGAVTQHVVHPVVSGEPILVDTVLTNTGNHHFKARAEVRIEDAQGALVAEKTTGLSEMSIVPTFARRFAVSFGLLDRFEGLPAGQYWAHSRVVREDGTLLDERRTPFLIAAPFVPFAGLSESDVVIATFAGEEPGCVDARPVAPLELCFSDTGAVTGTVAVGWFRQEPPAGASFSTREAEGGTGGTALGFAALRVDGFDRGTAQATWFYDTTQLADASPTSLFLGYWNGQSWLKLDDLAVFTGAGNVQGDIRVDALARAPVVALGGEPAGGLGGFLASDGWLLLAGAVVALVVLGAIFALRRRRRGRPDFSELTPTGVAIAGRKAAPGGQPGSHRRLCAHVGTRVPGRRASHTTTRREHTMRVRSRQATLMLVMVLGFGLLALAGATGAMARVAPDSPSVPAQEPATVVIGLIPESQPVDPGQNLTVTLAVTTAVPIRSLQWSLRFDPSVVQATGFQEGPFFRTWAEANGAMALLFPSQIPIDNTAGKAGVISINIMGGADGGPAGGGVIGTFALAIKPDAAGGATALSLEDIVIGDAQLEPVTDVELDGATLVVSGPAETPTDVPTETPQPTATESATATTIPSPQPTATETSSAPQVALGLLPPSRTAEPGATIAVSVSISAQVPIRTMQCSLRFDPTVLEATGFEEGTFFSAWAEAHGGTALLFPSQVPIDNTLGKAGVVSITIMGGEDGGPSGDGVFGVFLLKVKDDAASGPSEMRLDEVVIGDAALEPVPFSVEGALVEVTGGGPTPPGPTLTPTTEVPTLTPEPGETLVPTVVPSVTPGGGYRAYLPIAWRY